MTHFDDGGTFLTKHHVDVAPYCIRSSRVTELGNFGDKGPSHNRLVKKNAFTESREQSKMEAAFEKNDPHSWKSSYKKIGINLFVDDLFGTKETK